MIKDKKKEHLLTYKPNGMIWLNTTLMLMTGLIEKYKASMMALRGMKSPQSTPYVDCTYCRASIKDIAIALPVISTARDRSRDKPPNRVQQLPTTTDDQRHWSKALSSQYNVQYC